MAAKPVFNDNNAKIFNMIIQECCSLFNNIQRPVQVNAVYSVEAMLNLVKTKLNKETMAVMMQRGGSLIKENDKNLAQQVLELYT